MAQAAIPWIMAGISAGTAIYQGQQQKKMADYQADQAAADARAERSAAELEAEKIRELGKRQRSAARASYAASGVEVGEGTALQIDKEIGTGAEEDAQVSIFGGKDAFARGMQRSSAFEIQGQQAKTASYLEAANSAYGGYSDWRKMKPG